MGRGFRIPGTARKETSALVFGKLEEVSDNCMPDMWYESRGKEVKGTSTVKGEV